jgi:hypothetical protein
MRLDCCVARIEDAMGEAADPVGPAPMVHMSECFVYVVADCDLHICREAAPCGLHNLALTRSGVMVLYSSINIAAAPLTTGAI